jgi:hypothetical protein
VRFGQLRGDHVALLYASVKRIDRKTLAFTSSNKLVLILDVTSGDLVKSSAATNANGDLVAGASYTQATPSDTPFADWNFSVYLVETSP